MIPHPRRTVSTPATPPAFQWPGIDDDDGWQDMPVVRSDDNPFGLDEEDQRRFHYRPPARLDPSDPADPGASATASTSGLTSGPTSNATGQHLELEGDTLITDSWRQKAAQDESDYTRLRLDEDEESDEVHMRTKYLFNEDKAMTPLSQMQATKELLTEGQRIAYVGLCQLIGRRMVREVGRGWQGLKVGGLLGKGKGKAENPAVEDAGVWILKIMARLYQHMELEKEEQRMIESLAEHGVDPSDLVPALMTTHTVHNPDFDPQAKKAAELGTVEEEEEEMEKEDKNTDADPGTLDKEKQEKENEAARTTEDMKTPPPPYTAAPVDSTRPFRPTSCPTPRAAQRMASSSSTSSRSIPMLSPTKSVNPFGDDDDEEEGGRSPPPSPPPLPTSSSSSSFTQHARPIPLHLSLNVDDDEDGDIGRSISPGGPVSATSTQTAATPRAASRSLPGGEEEEIAPVRDPEKRPRRPGPPGGASPSPKGDSTHLPDPEEPASLPALPGVSTSLSNTDETVTLDIRWTVLCDLFLVLIADSVYDARSRAYLQNVAAALGFGWLDVVRFENRVTDALEIEEGVESMKAGEVIEGRRKRALKKRYAMMGLAAVGGGLVIGLSAGLLAPVIGAGLGAAFATVGISGTSTFLAGAGGAAMITTGGVLTGANIAGQGMARRTREVRTFELKPLHNNKRVSCYVTVGGFMSGKFDDPRLPFSVMDPVVGDVFSVLWEPEMMNEMGNALKILTTEVITQVGQQVLQATVMAALMSALQWPMILTKLGYLIDNPWSNALDRARAAGLVLADTIMQRHAGVRPVSLIGFSLGARAIVYCLIELARCKAYGLVQDVFIFGTTITVSRVKWLEARSAVAGRFVNGYSTNDWMLGYLFRATSGGLMTVAGLRPVETVPGLENIEVTEIIHGHMSYRSCMPQLLAKVDIPVTAEMFDEPEDPDVDNSIQERTTEEELEARRNRKKILGIFPRRAPRTASSTSTPSLPPVATSEGSRRQSGSATPTEDDDELPPREDGGDIGAMPLAGTSRDSVMTTGTEDEEVRAISKTAGFDFQAISKELGKQIDVEKIKPPPAKHAPGTIGIQGMERPPVERTASAPPIAIVTPPSEARSATQSMSKSASFGEARSGEVNGHHDRDEDDEGDITSTSSNMKQLNLDMPSWDRSSSFSTATFNGPPKISPPLANAISGTSWKGPSFSFNAWSSSNSSVASSSPAYSAPRAAPPARPHPAELMANPFAGNNGTGAAQGGLAVDKGILGVWGKKAPEEEERWSEKNPW